MNAIVAPRMVRWLMLLLLLVCGQPLLASPLEGAEPAQAEAGLTSTALAPAEGGMMLQGNVVMELVSNRARLIQVSLVCVTLGCALLWWRR